METTTKMLTIDPSTPILPSWANAAVYFVREAGEYIFAARKDDRTISKFLRPADVKAAFTHQETDTGWIGANVVRIGSSSRGSWFIYRRGAERVPICFDGDRNKYLIPIPPTILLGVGNNCYIFAVDNKPVHDGTRLYRAPFPNVYDNGRICWGSNHPPKSNAPNAGEKAWSLFFASPFTCHLDEGHLAKKTDLLGFLKSLNAKKTFPARMLVQHEHELRTMKEMLSQIVRATESEEE